ncbi:M1 family metallopeptidase [Parvularcula flava]|uniref:Aminopeptidase n=1 Tax=Aquisalinus luteolus TaxID=1566827 RepID=A0A8J3A2H1_9PROT|nr:M1 family metallopeptidase [Aquisalinus luteolus]NHK28307.1 M1 family metallopeptidase [Aquisalinus luteolus]GGH98081.1 aminopeptidase [Aquisalinus luteolus]
MFSSLRAVFALPFIIAAGSLIAPANAEIGDGAKKFRQLEDDLMPTPNVYRAATGEPGPQYWQQKVDYVIDVTLDTENKRILGEEEITYTNNSPHALKWIWVQMDQNRFTDGSVARESETSSTAGQRWDPSGDGDTLSFSALARQQALSDRDFGFKIQSITARNGSDLDYSIVDTHMRVDLPRPLAPGQSTEFTIEWQHEIIQETIVGGRGGYEHFEETDTYQYALAQWYPRVAVFSDYEGWHTKNFLGRGEFPLEFGDFDVSITVPSDHIVSATGVLQNPGQVLTATQRDRLEEARTADIPVFIVTPEEAKANEAEEASDTKTWRFSADNVRDFSFASSNKYIWDAQGYTQEGGPDVMAMSFYPNEAEPIWSMYSTDAVIHTMEVYSRFSFPYPYPTAQSVNAWESGGMEYPMITFNGYRPTKDEKSGEITYSRRTKYGLIGVIIHEIGHIYFPMVVNSDERQWTWMDEGLNSFLDYVAAIEWEENYPAYGDNTNVLDYITGYMTSEDQVPIMTQSDSVLNLGPNAYSKPTAALIVMRETVMGRELFDFALREYSQRWKFKRPTPYDFFRTMEEASGVDLDWFWRGWYYSTDHVDIAIKSVREYQISSQEPEVEFALDRIEAGENEPEPLIQRRNREEGMETYVERNPRLRDFYNENDRFTVTNKDRNTYQSFREGLVDWEVDALDRALADGTYVYFMDFANIGGLVMPIPLTITYADGSEEYMKIPAEIWRRDASNVTKLMLSDRQITSIVLDKNHEIADADRSNNAFPATISSSRIELYKSNRSHSNMMADMLVELKGQDKDAAQTESEGNAVPLQPTGN